MLLPVVASPVDLGGQRIYVTQHVGNDVAVNGMVSYKLAARRPIITVRAWRFWQPAGCGSWVDIVQLGPHATNFFVVGGGGYFEPGYIQDWAVTARCLEKHDHGANLVRLLGR